MAKSKILKGEWGKLKAAEINRLLKPFGVRLLVKHSKNWGAEVAVTAERIPAKVLPLAPAPIGVVIPPLTDVVGQASTLVPNLEVVFDDPVTNGDVESVSDLVERYR